MEVEKCRPVGKLTLVEAKAEEVRRKPVGKLTLKEAAPVGALAPAVAEEQIVGQEVIDHLKLREGVESKSYNDTLGKLTGGVGHLLSREEQALYPEGTHIPQEVVDGWLKADSTKAYKAAQKQAQELGEGNEELITALTSVNFQLGTNWNKIHKNTWKLMKKGKYEEAAQEAADSKWNEQTPVRVEDFQQALQSQAEVNRYKSMDDGVYEDPESGERFEVKGGRRR